MMTSGGPAAKHEYGHVFAKVMARACDVLTVGAMASGGSGRLISTFVAELRSLNWLRALTRYSVRLRLCLSTTHSTHMSGLTF